MAVSETVSFLDIAPFGFPFLSSLDLDSCGDVVGRDMDDLGVLEECSSLRFETWTRSQELTMNRPVVLHKDGEPARRRGAVHRSIVYASHLGLPNQWPEEQLTEYPLAVDMANE